MDATNSSNPPIKRRVGYVTATSIVVANMVGSGIFITSGFMASYLPSPIWVIACWFFGGLIALSGALCYAELATRIPEEGGEYIYLKKLFHPLFGFLSGWTSFLVGFSAPIAGSALGFSAYMFASSSPSTSGFSSFELLFLKKSIAVFVIAIFTAIHYVGIRLGSKVQNLLTILKIAIVLGLSAIGLTLGNGDWSNFNIISDSGFQGFAFGTAMMLVMFAYSGWNASAYIAGEIKNPRKNLPRSLITGTLIVTFLYLGINLFIFYALPYQQAAGVEAIVEAASINAFGNWMGRTLGVLIAIGLLSSISAFIMIGPRIYFAMARDKLFFSFAGKVHPKYQVPGKSILIQGSIAVLMVVFSSIEQLVIYLIYALNIFSWLAVASLFIARKRNIGETRAAKVPAYPFIPLFFLISSFILMIFAYINRPLESTTAIITILIGVPIYYLWKRGGINFGVK